LFEQQTSPSWHDTVDATHDWSHTWAAVHTPEQQSAVVSQWCPAALHWQVPVQVM